jgi:hypothetical protein
MLANKKLAHVKMFDNMESSIAQVESLRAFNKKSAYRKKAIKTAKDTLARWELLAKAEVVEDVLPDARVKKDMIDSAEYLRRHGHSEPEIRHLASEFGRSLKIVKEYLTGTVNGAEGSIQLYHATTEATLLGDVYCVFRQRPLYTKHVRGLRKEVETALKGTRGFPTE